VHDATIARLLDLAATPRTAIPESARRAARFSLYDWMAVVCAGCNQPLSRIIRRYVAEEGGRPVAALVGEGVRVPARAAALANGASSHALDYDDTHFAHVGHPSVAVLPAALAVAEETDASAAELLDAFVLGAEASVRVGVVLGSGHYERGFHQTATAGAFGATVAAAQLYGLPPDRARHALGLVSTRASGLKSQFGTMGKPFNAGIAAANGVEAAALAGRGFQSCDDGFDGPQGFRSTHSDGQAGADAWADPPPGRFLFEGVTYKFHACCHGTHAATEALMAARRDGGVTPARVAAIELRVNPRWLKVCDIRAPRTGLEVKFSYAWLAAMALHGQATADESSFPDALCHDPGLAALAGRVEVTGDPALADTETRCLIMLDGGARIEVAHDLTAPVPAARIESGLRAKAAGLLGQPAAERLWSAVAELGDLSARDVGALLADLAQSRPL
jgi:2-methylcitrate dehydratase PrpD